MCWQVCAVLLGSDMQIFDLQVTQHVRTVWEAAAVGQSSLTLTFLEGMFGVDQQTLTVDTRGAMALLTLNTKSSTASDDMSSPSTSSRCVASSTSFAVKRRLFTSLRKIPGSRFIRCKAFAAYIHISPFLPGSGRERSKNKGKDLIRAYHVVRSKPYS